MTEPLVTELLVQVYFKPAAVTVYDRTVNLQGLEVKVCLIILKMFLDAGANGIVCLGLKAPDRQYDGQCRQQSSHAPEHNQSVCYFLSLVSLSMTSDISFWKSLTKVR